MNWIKFIQNKILAKNLPGYNAHQQMMKHLKRPSYDMAPSDAKLSAVLIYITQENEQYYTYLIQRKVDQSIHSGQISFPGGKKDEEDYDIIATAIREAREEININVNAEEIIGQLTPLYIPVSNFVVYPVIAFSNKIQDILPSENEVAAIIKLPINELFINKVQKMIVNKEISYNVTAYNIDDERFVWGATAMILAEIEALWHQFNNTSPTSDLT